MRIGLFRLMAGELWRCFENAIGSCSPFGPSGYLRPSHSSSPVLRATRRGPESAAAWNCGKSSMAQGALQARTGLFQFAWPVEPRYRKGRTARPEQITQPQLENAPHRGLGSPFPPREPRQSPGQRRFAPPVHGFFSRHVETLPSPKLIFIYQLSIECLPVSGGRASMPRSPKEAGDISC